MAEAKAVKKPNPALAKPLQPSNELAAVVGSAPLPRTEVVSKVWEYIKANNDKVTLANAGLGAVSHLCGMLLQEALATQVTTVPYKGTGPAMNDIMGGQVDLVCDQTTNTTGPIGSGKVKGYAVTTRERVIVSAYD